MFKQLIGKTCGLYKDLLFIADDKKFIYRFITKNKLKKFKDINNTYGFYFILKYYASAFYIIFINISIIAILCSAFYMF